MTRSNAIWAAVLLGTQVVQGVAQQELRVEPREAAVADARFTLEEAFAWKEQFCPDPAIDLMIFSDERAPFVTQAVYPEAQEAQRCKSAGEFCGWSSQCCSLRCLPIWECAE